MKFTKIGELLIVDSKNVNNAILRFLSRGKKTVKIDIIPLYDKYFVLKEQTFDGRFERREKRKNLSKIIYNSEQFLDAILQILEKKKPELIIICQDVNKEWFHKAIDFLKEICGKEKITTVSFEQKRDVDLVVSPFGLSWN